MESFIRDATDRLEELTAQISNLRLEMEARRSVREGLERKPWSEENSAELKRLREAYASRRKAWERAETERRTLSDRIEEASRRLGEIRAGPPQQTYDVRKFSLGGPSRKF